VDKKRRSRHCKEKIPSQSYYRIIIISIVLHSAQSLRVISSFTQGRVVADASPPFILLSQFRNRSSVFSSTMPNGVQKENLPTKICVSCNRPFTWRKKWERCWEEVTTCSKSCNRQRRSQNANVLSRTKVEAAEQKAFIDIEEENSLSKELAESTNGINEADISEEVLKLLQLDLECTISVDSDSEDEAKKDNTRNDKQLLHKNSEQFDEKALRKQRRKEVKTERRRKREGNAGANVGRKLCTVCSKQSDSLVRCMIGECNLFV